MSPLVPSHTGFLGMATRFSQGENLLAKLMLQSHVSNHKNSIPSSLPYWLKTSHSPCPCSKGGGGAREGYTRVRTPTGGQGGLFSHGPPQFYRAYFRGGDVDVEHSMFQII